MISTEHLEHITQTYFDDPILMKIIHFMILNCLYKIIKYEGYVLFSIHLFLKNRKNRCLLLKTS